MEVQEPFSKKVPGRRILILGTVKYKSRTTEIPSLKVFLSHRYKSPVINEYFFEAFSQIAEIQFEVDEGTEFTCVTRLERMIRDANAFVGIYPLPEEYSSTPTKEQLLHASRYFRLEFDLAVRARKPSIVFLDQRYRNIVQVPSSVVACRFDHQEVHGNGGSPSIDRFYKSFELFKKITVESMHLKAAQASLHREPTTIGILLPPQEKT